MCKLPIEFSSLSVEGAEGKRTSAVEYKRAKPRGVRAWAHDPNVPLVPFSCEERPCF
jgi:hypothetical protein